MIFDYNKWKHDFYVEESYVISWMYPFLSPHGLIMKINSEHTPLNQKMAEDDLYFWDWYVRRFNNNPKFLRDVVARKSFSKLRSAIGGLYSNRGQLANAEQAFQEARLLYSLSPEANFRLVQEVLLRQGRFAEATLLMQEFAVADPGNERIPEFLKHLERIQSLDSRIRELEGRRQNGTIDIASALELAELYRQAQQTERFNEIIDGILRASNLPPQVIYQVATKLHQAKEYTRMDAALQSCIDSMSGNTPPELYLNMARMYADAKNPQRMIASIQSYLRLKPDDWKAWLDLSYLLLSMQQQPAAAQALSQARRVGGAEAEATIRQDNRFAPLLQNGQPNGRSLLGLPGVTPTGS